jgi:hypothetical protein
MINTESPIVKLVSYLSVSNVIYNRRRYAIKSKTESKTELEYWRICDCIEKTQKRKITFEEFVEGWRIFELYKEIPNTIFEIAKPATNPTNPNEKEGEVCECRICNASLCSKAGLRRHLIDEHIDVYIKYTEEILNKNCKKL